jgi:hypothetical protein
MTLYEIALASGFTAMCVALCASGERPKDLVIMGALLVSPLCPLIAWGAMDPDAFDRFVKPVAMVIFGAITWYVIIASVSYKVADIRHWFRRDRSVRHNGLRPSPWVKVLSKRTK